MRKLIISGLAAATLLATLSVANAGYWTPYGYVVTCGWTPWGYICN